MELDWVDWDDNSENEMGFGIKFPNLVDCIPSLAEAVEIRSTAQVLL